MIPRIIVNVIIIWVHHCLSHINSDGRIPDSRLCEHGPEAEGGPSLTVVIDNLHAGLTGVVELFAGVPEEPEDVTDFAFPGKHFGKSCVREVEVGPFVQRSDLLLTSLELSETVMGRCSNTEYWFW